MKKKNFVQPENNVTKAINDYKIAIEVDDVVRAKEKKLAKSSNLDLSKLVKPVRNNVFVELFEEDELLANGIIKPSSQLETEPFSRVIAVSEQVKGIKIGDLVLMRVGINADVFKVKGKKYAMLTDFDIVSVIEQEFADEMKKAVKPKVALDN